MRRRAFPRQCFVFDERVAWTGLRAADTAQLGASRRSKHESAAGAASDSSRKTLAFAALLLGAAAIAFAPIFVRLADTGPSASAFWRVRWRQRRCAVDAPVAAPQGAQRLPWKALTIAGLCFAAILGAWHVSIMYTTVANSTSKRTSRRFSSPSRLLAVPSARVAPVPDRAAVTLAARPCSSAPTSRSEAAP